MEDSRRKPGTKAPLVAAAVSCTGLLRIRSFNALEPRLREKAFLRMVGVQRERMRLCSVDTLSRALRVTDLESARAVAVAIVQKAERNKVFREGWHGALRYVAIDGWEPFSAGGSGWVRRLDVVFPDGRTRMGQPGGAVLYFALGASLCGLATGIVSLRGADCPAWARPTGGGEAHRSQIELHARPSASSTVPGPGRA